LQVKFIILIFVKQLINQTMYQVKSNQYIPYRAKTLPSGMPACSTYYYVTNEQGKVISHKTLKPYRGKDMANYKFNDQGSAESFANQLNQSANV
jgi:hypothetical protein